MASPRVGSLPPKLSFAKIAAMPPPNLGKSPAVLGQDPSRPTEKNPTRTVSQSSNIKPPISPPASHSLTKADHEPINDLSGITGAIEGLALVRDASLEKSGGKGNLGADSAEDDQSHLSNSSSKPQSFDTKSMASVTTFAMDEKESIRPDDSASVRAGDEEESSSGSNLNAGAQSTAEQAVIAARANPRFGVNGVTIAARRYPTFTMANPPRFGDLPVSPVIEPEDGRGGEAHPEPLTEEDSATTRLPTLVVAPDEKLLDALATPKDRLPLLQLEEKVILFLVKTREPFLDLPPQNSFARMLAHKLADYYSLEHHITEDNSSVRMYRTSSSILPTPLSILAQSIPIGPLPPAGAANFKIMRRNGLGNRQLSAGGSTPASSSVPSKTTSETGAETSDEGLMSPSEGTPARDKPKLTREEREANYKAARDRIFADVPESTVNENISTEDTSASMSRSSSSSGKRKSRRQKTPKDDSFEARSSFVVGYPGMPLSAMPAPYQPNLHNQSLTDPYNNNSAAYGINYGSTPTQTYAGFDSSAGYDPRSNFIPNGSQQYSSNDMWVRSQSPQTSNYSYGYNTGNQPQQMYPQHLSSVQPVMNGQYGHQYASNLQPAQNWTPPQFPNSYQSSPHVLPNSQYYPWQNYGTSAVPSTSPYPYGQLPSQPYPPANNYSNQHPVPGSYGGNYNRSLFNPQTRSFVPSNPATRTVGRNNRKKGTSVPVLTRNGSTPSSLSSDTASVAMTPKGLRTRK